ncbi:ATP-dependent DNA helicase RecG [Motilimonas pumila]|uniref:ATP-dependent DNA helicase RecG n=1 Tax=Motilimonas pumila TaxID=2303987 RepID=A0A418YH89_9GAMM|nr:ATP-dependent DNA helicase RecG [Motilimonas pumila]RJG49404.1 ATP-dependent DNA helicase RecG [Motilimonas pumila]
MNLDKLPLTTLKGVGSKLAEKLGKLHLHTVQDLLFHLPLRYEDRTHIYPIQDALPGLHGAILAEIKSSQIIFGRRRMLSCKVSDGTGSITLLFFHFNAGQKNALATGKWIKCFGEFRRGKFGYEMTHPEYKILNDPEDDCCDEALTPVYPTTEGLKQNSFRQLLQQAVALLQQHGISEALPASLTQQQGSLQQALTYLHQPPPDADTESLQFAQHPAQQRLILEELIAHNLSMLLVRQKTTQYQAVSVKHQGQLKQQLLAQLPFTPTDAQQRVNQDIFSDLQKNTPMMRLVQGDVGSGKTLVAALAALDIIEAGYQVALMAPTELLAEQHGKNFAVWFEPLGIKVGWLAGKVKGKQREEQLQAYANGSIKMIVGTHALFQQEVAFDNLALIIVDEQHRFGVHQRLALREKGQLASFAPHQLIMTATPIPRTLAMTAYADLDTSIIDALPPGRTPVTTVAIPDTRREQILQRVQQACGHEKRQAYWVCTLIEESEVLECQAAEDTATELQDTFPQLRVGLVHGRMKPAEKQYVMDSFKAAELDLLVATTVIEVGVDVPNASLMIIENPERLGLAQLHQLRGRVGRGATASHCVLLYKNPLSQTANQRLGVLRESNDGFHIAQKDLEIRGPGELLGSKQTGLADLRIADLSRDHSLIPQVQKMAKFVFTEHPECVKPLVTRWLGDREVYSQA